MAMIEGLRPSPLFESLSKNILKTLLTPQDKADKYIAVKEVADAKRKRRGKEYHKMMEPDSQMMDYRGNLKHGKLKRVAKRKINDWHP